MALRAQIKWRCYAANVQVGDHATLHCGRYSQSATPPRQPNQNGFEQMPITPRTKATGAAARIFRIA